MKNLAIINGLWNGLANIVGIVTGVLGSMLIVRSLSPSEYGEFSYYIWLAGIFGTVGILSFPNAVTKISSELRGNGRVQDAQNLAFGVALGIVVLNLILAVGLSVFALTQSSPQRLYLLMIAFILIPNGLYSVMRSLHWGKQTYLPITRVQILTLLLQFFFVVGVYRLNMGVIGYVASVLSSYVFQAIFLTAVMFSNNETFCRPIQALPRRPDTDIWKRYFSFAFPFVFFMVFEVVVWQRSEIFFLNNLNTIEQVGYYNLAYTFFGMFLGLGQALMYGYYPAISHDFGAKAWTLIQHKVSQGVLFALLFSLPVAFGSLITAPTIVLLLYGTKMEPAIAVARVLLLSLIPGTIAYLALYTINAIGGVWVNVGIGAVMMFLNVIMDLVLIPGFGAFGAAVANTLAQTFTTILVIIILKKMYSIRMPWKEMALLIIIGLGSTLIIPLVTIKLLPGLGGLIIAVSISALIYISSIWRLGYLSLAGIRKIAGVTI